MTYQLRLDPTLHGKYAKLPDDARRDLGACLLDTLADPIAHSLPYGEDDGVMRTVARGYVTAVILIGEKTVTVVQITYAG